MLQVISIVHIHFIPAVYHRLIHACTQFLIAVIITIKIIFILEVTSLFEVQVLNSPVPFTHFPFNGSASVMINKPNM